MEELRELDQMTRKQMNIYKSLHPRSDIDRLYVPRKKGGRGLRSLEDLVLIEKTSLAEYVNNSQEPTLQKLKSEGIVKDSVSTKQKKEEIEKDREDKWRRKTLHGKWPETLNKVSSETSRWLQTAQLKPPTEALIMAAQDQAINTNWYSHHILKNSPSDKCRLCNEHPETIEHITTGCPKLAQTIYLDRHNAVASTLHWSLCKQMNFERAENWWEHQPEPAMENEDYKLLYDFNIRTDKKISARRPDIVVVDKNERRTTLIDVACT